MSTRPPLARRTGAAAICAAALVAAVGRSEPAAAAPASVEVVAERGVLIYRAAPRQANDVRITWTANRTKLTVADDVPITAGAGCAADSHTAVSCDSVGIVVAIEVETGDLNDRVTLLAPHRSTVAGGAGDDTLLGGPGPDILDGGPGADYLAGGGGGAFASYANRTNPIIVDLGRLTGGQGESGEGDTIAADVNGVIGGNAGDALQGDDGPNVIYGGPGNDDLLALAGNDSLYGGPGEDGLFAGAGDDYVVDGEGPSTYVVGDAGADTVLFYDAAAPLSSIGSRNTVFAGDGDDRMFSGYGHDVFHGGPGTDSVSYQFAGQGVVAVLGGTVDNGAPGEQDSLDADIENLHGSAYGDRVHGEAGPNVLDGGGGDDEIYGRDGGDRLYGSDGNDVLNGGAGADTIRGGTGVDRLLGLGGRDDLWGEVGNDIVDGSANTNTCRANDGDDMRNCHIWVA